LVEEGPFFFNITGISEGGGLWTFGVPFPILLGLGLRHPFFIKPGGFGEFGAFHLFLFPKFPRKRALVGLGNGV